MVDTELLSTEKEYDPPNEELLNVIRESDERGVGTSEIVAAVDLGHDAVRDRMRGMEAEGRVESITVGSQDDYSFVWFLADGERKDPVNPDIDRLVYWCDSMRAIAEEGRDSGQLSAVVGVALIIVTLGSTFVGIRLAGFDPEGLVWLGLAFVFGGLVVYGAGSGLKAIAELTEMYGERKVSK